MKSYFKRFVRRVRRLVGLGWSIHEFEDRYRRTSGDAWGYLGNQSHELRLKRIVEKLPDNCSGTLLEVGCAEGFITKHLSTRFPHVVACDLSCIAIDHARKYCGEAKNIEFHCLDIRQGIPSQGIDVCLVSDVLYYLSPREIEAFAVELASAMNVGGLLIFANEWNSAYRDLTHPEKACRSIVVAKHWRQRSFEQCVSDELCSHWIGVFEVLKG